MLTWTTGTWWWVLGVAVAAPLAAHLLSRRGGRTVVFPTIRFLREAADEGRRRSRVQDLLLMLLRMAALVLLVLAFMRPLWHTTAPLAADRGLNVVVVVDRSASMTRSRDGLSLFEHARLAAIRELQALDPSVDRAAVVMADRSPHPLLPQPTGNIAQLVALLEAEDAGYERGDLSGAIDLAVRLAEHTDETQQPRQGHVVVISDMQATQALDANLPADLAARGIALRSTPVQGDTANLAVTDVRVTPVAPVVDQPATVTVDVSNFAPTDATTTVRLQLDSGVMARRLTLRADSVGSAIFPFTPGATDAAAIEATLSDGGALRVDDRNGIVVQPRQQRRVVLVTNEDVSDPNTAAFYFARALVPRVGDAADVDLQVRRPADLVEVLGGQVDQLVIAEAGPLPVDAHAALRRFLDRGGGVVWVLDSRAALGALDALAASQPDALMHPMPEARWQGGVGTRLSGGQFGHPMLAVFEGASRSALLNHSVGGAAAGDAARAAEVVLELDNGAPFVALQWVGSGRLAVINGDLSPLRSSFVKGRSFVPLLHQVIRHLSPGLQPQANPTPGGTARFSLTTGADVKVVGPDDRDIEASALKSQEGFQLQTEPLSQPGPHRVIESATAKMLDGVFVQIHPAESDLRVGASLRDVAAGGADSATASTVRPTPRELWPYLAGAALLLLVAEQVALLLTEKRWRRGGGATPAVEVISRA